MWDCFNDVDRYRKTQPLVSTTSVAAVVPELFESVGAELTTAGGWTCMCSLLSALDPGYVTVIGRKFLPSPRQRSCHLELQTEISPFVP